MRWLFMLFLMRADQFELAMRDYNRALQLQPACADAWYFRGALHEREGALEAAVADFTQVLALDANHVMASYARASCRNRQGDLYQAIGAWALGPGRTGPARARSAARTHAPRAHVPMCLHTHGHAHTHARKHKARTHARTRRGLHLRAGARHSGVRRLGGLRVQHAPPLAPGWSRSQEIACVVTWK